ncbi:MAG: response regulator transcription factor [Aggregatilineaceae bacterium]
MGSVYQPWHIAMVDDDSRLAEIVREELEAEGYEVSAFSSAETFLRHVQRQGLPHLALIDLGLPDMDGFALSNRLKALGDVPIIFISGRKETDTVVRGLVQYAEDYVRKPFDPRELAARIYRVLSRIPNFDYAERRLVRIDDWLAIDFGQRVLFAGDREYPLTPTEVTLLHILLRNADQVVPTRVLISRVWPLQDVYEETLRVHMHRLRQKVEPDPSHPRYLLTVRGVGYQFVRRSA